MKRRIKIKITDNEYSHVKPFDSTIYLGRVDYLSEEEIMATVFHEAGHIKNWHAEKNLINILFMKRIRKHKREAIADLYAVKYCGKRAVMSMLLKMYSIGRLSYREYMDRIYYMDKYGT